MERSRFYLKVSKMFPGAKINPPAIQGDVGYDVFCYNDIVLRPQARQNVGLGIKIEFPEGYGCFVHGKSGLASKFGIDTIGNVIDPNYRGEIHAQLVNTSDEWILIEAGSKIAQLVFWKIEVSPIEFVEELSKTERGEAGFGSTGK